MKSRFRANLILSRSHMIKYHVNSIFAFSGRKAEFIQIDSMSNT